MAGRKPKNTNEVFKEKKESATVVVVHQSSSSTTKAVAAKPTPQKRAPAEKKAVEKPAEKKAVEKPAEKPQRKPTVKQLEKKLGEHLEKADKLYKDLAAAKIGEQEKKKAATPKKPQPAVVVKIFK